MPPSRKILASITGELPLQMGETHNNIIEKLTCEDNQQSFKIIKKVFKRNIQQMIPSLM